MNMFTKCCGNPSNSRKDISLKTTTGKHVVAPEGTSPKSVGIKLWGILVCKISSSSCFNISIWATVVDNRLAENVIHVAEKWAICWIHVSVREESAFFLICWFEDITQLTLCASEGLSHYPFCMMTPCTYVKESISWLKHPVKMISCSVLLKTLFTPPKEASLYWCMQSKCWGFNLIDQYLLFCQHFHH